jgi:hypothetical protein
LAYLEVVFGQLAGRIKGLAGGAQKAKQTAIKMAGEPPSGASACTYHALFSVPQNSIRQTTPYPFFHRIILVKQMPKPITYRDT